MNDTTATHGNLLQMKEAVAKGRQWLEQIERNFDRLAALCARGHQLGMMDKGERDELANVALGLKFNTLAYHTRMTRIAQRNNADEGLTPGGGGEVGTQGGPGR